MNQDHIQPTHLGAFQEDLLFLNGRQELSQSERDAINEVLANNGAVGVIAGAYDEALTISFASYYFMRSLGYEYNEYQNYRLEGTHSLLDIVYEEDRDLFAPDSFASAQGRCDFRVLTRDGVPFYANAYKSECVSAGGERQWILSIRVSTESIDMTLSSVAERARRKAEAENAAATQALKDACAAANRANEAKTDFLAHMSHDIRTPLNAIIGMTALAGAHIDEKDRVRDSLEKITGASRHLLSLVNDLLDMSQIEKGTMTLAEEEIDLSDLINDMINMIRPEIASHHHNLEVAIEGVEHEHVIGDSLKIQQMFTNIMSNAIKYTPDGGNIRLTISEKGTNHARIGCYRFVFEDNGIGISKEFQKFLFDPFSRGRDQYVNHIQGSGLGMAITKNIVNLMDGEIEVESTPGEGSRFTVTIFLRLQEDVAMQDDALCNLPVLVVDDDEICCETAMDTLQSIGMSAESVTSGREAIDRTVARHERGEDYFVIIMDWIMPEMDGIETTREIRRRVGRDVPIIMLSAYDYSEIESQAREAGVDCFIAKPLFKSRLQSIFHQIVNGEHRQTMPGNGLEQIRDNDYSDKRILLVEDNELNLEIAMELVGMTGAQMETAVNGKEAVDLIAAAEKDYYDLVLMDIQMPVMNGYEAARAIRALPEEKGRDLPVVAMTANAFAEDVVWSKKAGFNDHLAKPIDINRLNQILQERL